MKTKGITKWVLGLTPLIGPLLLCGLAYWTWCWGYWGQGNLLMQYLFQCRYPAASEEARYKPFKVVASACIEPLLRGLSPSGKYLVIYQRSPSTQLVRLDLETGAMLDSGYTGAVGAFVTDDLLIVGKGADKGYTLIDFNDGTQMQLPDYVGLDAIIEKLKKAEKVYITDDTFFGPYVVGLAHDYKHNAEDNVALYWNAETQSLFDRLAENGIAYESSSRPYIEGLAPNHNFYSLDGQRLYADRKGIYLSENRQLIAASGQEHRTATTVGPTGWVLDNHAVIYGMGGHLYLVGGGENILVPGSFPVPQPILLLEVPQQYWVTSTPEP